MEREIDCFEKSYLRFGDSSADCQTDVFDYENDLNPVCREIDGAPDLLRKSVERFLIGNVV